MLVEVLIKHEYAGKTYEVGQTYEMTSRSHFRILSTLKKIKLAEQPAQQYTTRHMVAAAPDTQSHGLWPPASPSEPSEKPKKTSRRSGKRTSSNRSIF